MKRLISVILLLVCMTGIASAESPALEKDIISSFNSHSSEYGGEEISVRNMVYLKGQYVFRSEGYSLYFFQSDDGKVAKVGINMTDGSTSGNFLISCMSIMAMFAEEDFISFGKLLYQYGQAKKGGKEFNPVFLGSDAFAVAMGDGGEISFIYLNSDLSDPK